jgi:stage V sporulation protein B
LFRVYLANAIGSVSLGIYQIGFSVFIVLVAVVNSGLPLSVSKQTAKFRLQKNLTKEHHTVSASIILGLIFSLALFALLLLLKPLLVSAFSGERAYYVLLTLAPSLFAVSIFGAFKGSLWGQEKHFELSFIDLIEEMIKMAFTIFFLELGLNLFSGELSASISVTISCFISTLLTLRYYLKYNGKVVAPKKSYYKPLLKSSLPITGLRVSSSLIQPLIAILLPLRLVTSGFTKEQALSQLGIALGMTFPLLFLPLTIVGALSMTLIPSIVSLLQKKQLSQLKTQVNSSLQFTIFVSFLFIPVFTSLGIPLGEFLFSNTTSGVYLQQAAYLMLPISLANITASILNALNLEVKSFKNYILGSILLLLSLWFLPQYIGVRALIFGMGICMASVSILNLKMIEQATNERYFVFKPIFIMSLCFIPSSLIAQFYYYPLTYLFPNFIAILFSGAMSVVSFVILCVLCNIIRIDFWSFKLKQLLENKKQNSKQV